MMLFRIKRLRMAAYFITNAKLRSVWFCSLACSPFTSPSISTFNHFVLCRPESRAAAGLVERHQRRSQESVVPGHTAASAHRVANIRPPPPTCMPELHYLPESEQTTHIYKYSLMSFALCCLQRNQLSDCSVWYLNFLLLSQEDDEFRDKLTPISLALNYSLAPPSQNLPPVLNHYSSTFLQEHVSIYTVV